MGWYPPSLTSQNASDELEKHHANTQKFKGMVGALGASHFFIFFLLFKKKKQKKRLWYYTRILKYKLELV